MFITRKSLDRRTLLRGLGLGISLPLLDAMTPAFAANTKVTGKAAAVAPRRLAFCYVPNGIIMPAWTPATEGKGYELTRVMKPLEAYREKDAGAIGVGASQWTGTRRRSR